MKWYSFQTSKLILNYQSDCVLLFLPVRVFWLIIIGMNPRDWPVKVGLFFQFYLTFVWIFLKNKYYHIVQFLEFFQLLFERPACESRSLFFVLAFFDLCLDFYNGITINIKVNTIIFSLYPCWSVWDRQGFFLLDFYGLIAMIKSVQFQFCLRFPLSVCVR